MKIENPLREESAQKIHVPYGKAVYDHEEISAVLEKLKSGTQMGESTRLFENKIAQLFQKKFGLMVNSGSSANYLATEIFNLPKGSHVITPVLTFSTTIAPLVRNGLIPVFVDVEEDTYNIDADAIEAKITEQTKAMMIPNLIGNLPDWPKIRALADKYNLLLIEDSADTVGATIDGLKTGHYSDLSTTSFYGSHVISCAGNGGMLTVNNEELYDKARLLRSWGRNSSLFVESEKIENRFDIWIDGIQYDNKFVFSEFGYNLEPSEIGAAFGLIQLQKLEKNICLREQWFAKHMAFFKEYEEFFILPNQLKNSRTGWLAFPLIVKDEAPFSRTELQIYLEKQSIQTRTVFTGNILRQPCFASNTYPYVGNKEDYPNADQVMRGGILLACHNGLTLQAFEYLQNTLEKFCKLHLTK